MNVSVHTSVLQKDIYLLFSIAHGPDFKQQRIVTRKGERFTFETEPHNLLCVFAYTCRDNDDGLRVAHPLGFAGVSNDHTGALEFVDRTDPSRAVELTTHVKVEFTDDDGDAINNSPVPIPPTFRSEANLQRIYPYGKVGPLYAPIVDGLDLVHSPYFDTQAGCRLPSGTFTLIQTEIEGHLTISGSNEILQKRLQLACTKFGRTVQSFMDNPGDAAYYSIVAEFLTAHARERIRYTPDVQLRPKIHGTERWEVPREPRADGSLCYAGDCEDYAREVFQTYKDSVTLSPYFGPSVQYMAKTLKQYVPVLMQGAVGGQFHSKYVKGQAKFRNHIWAAMIPREMFPDPIHEGGPARKTNLPILLCDATGYEVPVYTTQGTKPQIGANQQTPEVPNGFYEYAISCMTDVFKDDGILNFIFVTDEKYGCPFDSWWRGEFSIYPAAIFSQDEIHTMEEILRAERPIRPVMDMPEVVEEEGADENGVHHGQVVRETVYDEGIRPIEPRGFKSKRRIRYKNLLTQQYAQESTIEWFV